MNTGIIYYTENKCQHDSKATEICQANYYTITSSVSIRKAWLLNTRVDMQTLYDVLTTLSCAYVRECAPAQDMNFCYITDNNDVCLFILLFIFEARKSEYCIT